METVNVMASKKPVVVFSKSSCCMSHSIKSLLYTYGVNVKAYELDEMSRGHEIEQELSQLGGNHPTTVPAVFIGGEFVGGANEIMSMQLRNLLKPMLIRAGAL